MKRKLQFLRTLFWRERYEIPQRTSLGLRLTNDAKHSHGRGWTVVILKEGWK